MSTSTQLPAMFRLPTEILFDILLLRMSDDFTTSVTAFSRSVRDMAAVNRAFLICVRRLVLRFSRPALQATRIAEQALKEHEFILSNGLDHLYMVQEMRSLVESLNTRSNLDAPEARKMYLQKYVQDLGFALHSEDYIKACNDLGAYVHDEVPRPRSQSHGRYLYEILSGFEGNHPCRLCVKLAYGAIDATLMKNTVDELYDFVVRLSCEHWRPRSK